MVDGGCNPRLNRLIWGALPGSELVIREGLPRSELVILEALKHAVVIAASDVVLLQVKRTHGA